MNGLTQLDFYHHKLNIYKLTHHMFNVPENIKIEGTHSLVPNLLSKNKKLALAPENWTKLTLREGPTLLDFIN